ncbi:MAG: endonuclease/exonuclease/phosphatase family protein [Acidobacteriota bacterium]
MRLTLATYNIHRAIGVDRRFRPQRVARILDDHQADIILLQEVDEGAPRSRELNLAKELASALGMSYYALGHNVSLRKGWYGNATLSRFPILRERNIDLTIGRRKRRGCQHTSIEVETEAGASHRLEVFNLHLGLSARERQKQAGLLARSEEMSELSPEVSCILGGDFNDWRSLLRAVIIEGLGFDCASDRRTRNGPKAIKTYPAISPRGGLDRIYYRGSIRLLSAYRCRHRAAKVASDHLPLIAEFEIR